MSARSKQGHVCAHRHDSALIRPLPARSCLQRVTACHNLQHSTRASKTQWSETENTSGPARTQPAVCPSNTQGSSYHEKPIASVLDGRGTTQWLITAGENTLLHEITLMLCIIKKKERERERLQLRTERGESTEGKKKLQCCLTGELPPTPRRCEPRPLPALPERCPAAPRKQISLRGRIPSTLLTPSTSRGAAPRGQEPWGRPAGALG